MKTWAEVKEDIIGKRESEFTGRKGQLLRYGGFTFVLLIVIQLVKAFMLLFGAQSAAIDVHFLLISLAAFAVYPVYRGIVRACGFVPDRRNDIGTSMS